MDPATHSVHRTPGRLRVRLSSLKRDGARARRLQSCLASASGVESVELNPLTGSLLTHFDPSQSSHEALLKIVSDNEPAMNEAVMNAQVRISPTAGNHPHRTEEPRRFSMLGRTATEVACAYAGKMLVEHAVEALVAVIF